MRRKAPRVMGERNIAWYHRVTENASRASYETSSKGFQRSSSGRDTENPARARRTDDEWKKRKGEKKRIKRALLTEITLRPAFRGERSRRSSMHQHSRGATADFGSGRNRRSRKRRTIVTVSESCASRTVPRER